MPLKTIQAKDPDVNTVQANVSEAIDRLEKTDREIEISSVVEPGVYMVSTSDRYILVDASGGPVRVSLPSPQENQEIWISRTDSTGNTATAERSDGEKISGSANIPITSAALHFVCDGKTWLKL